ncbi:DMT family transporter [Lacibacterium aquatile]|uniref:DMT family transporter n=1 Tax=Lacibacterium aquatile TaxID=1168082 RepID=A0ABW5DJZ8_9PROT
MISAQEAENRRKGLILLSMVTLIWGCNWPIMKTALTEIPPFWFVVYRFVLGGACITLLVALRGNLKLPHRQDWPLVGGSALMQMAAYSIFIVLGLKDLPAGRAALLAYTTPIWVIPLARLYLKEEITLKRALAVVLGVGGILVLIWPQSISNIDMVQLGAYGLMALSALAWAISIVQVRGHKFVGTALDLAPWQMLIALMVLIPLAFVMDGPPQFAFSGTAYAAMAYIGPLATAFAFWAIVAGGRLVPANVMSIAMLAAPLIGLTLSVSFMGEQITLPLVVGILMIGMSLLLNLKR